jgi:two-component system response regulator VicR
MTPRRILIVEDDAAIAHGIELNLKLAGFAAAVAGDGETALELLAREPMDLILLDIALPGQSGLQVLAALRERGLAVPVIVLSARQHEVDKVAALRLGADDYVTKPFGVAELLARIDAVLRRAASAPVAPEGATPAAAETLAFGDVRLDLERREVTRKGIQVPLTHLEFELLAFLCRNAGKVFARDDLLRRVWGIQHSGSARTVDNFVAQLRAKLEQDPEQPRHLITVRGSGYRFDR